MKKQWQNTIDSMIKHWTVQQNNAMTAIIMGQIYDMVKLRISNVSGKYCYLELKTILFTLLFAERTGTPKLIDHSPYKIPV